MNTKKVIQSREMFYVATLFRSYGNSNVCVTGMVHGVETASNRKSIVFSAFARWLQSAR